MYCKYTVNMGADDDEPQGSDESDAFVAVLSWISIASPQSFIIVAVNTGDFMDHIHHH